MTNSVDLNSIAFENLLNAFAHRVCDIFEARYMKNMPVLNAGAKQEPYTEKPMTRKETCKHYGVSVPTLKNMVKGGAVIEFKLSGVRGFRYLPSTLNQALKPVK